jgi:uncharacterized membrane protein
MGTAAARQPRFDPATKRVRIIYLGDAWGISSPIFEMYKDPMFMATSVPASEGHVGGLGDVSRFLRIYMPRTYSDYVTFFDVTILSDTQSHYYSLKQIGWFETGVEEDGQGLLMVGGREIVHGYWDGTPVEEALPAEFLGTMTSEFTPFWGLPTDPDDEFITALPFENMPPYLGALVVSPKDGSETILQSSFKDFPVLIFRDYGKGSSMFHTPDWTPLWGGEVNIWEYFGDYVSNMLYKVSGLAIPQDPALMHFLREHFGDFQVKRGMILSLAEFIDKFGANTAVLDRELAAVSIARNEVTDMYLEQEYESALSRIQALLDEMDRVIDLAFRLKDRAMLWIYITEVSAVTGTAMVSGAILWLLMVRRKLYREVAVSRPTKRLEE